MAKPKPLFSRWLLLLPIPMLWCVASHFGWLEFIERRTVDWRFRVRGELSAPVKIVYVDIDSKSITDLGNMPWDRAYYSDVCAALLKAGGVKAIGVDLVFSEKGQPELSDRARFAAGNRKLFQFLFAQPPVVLAAAYASSDDRDINGNPIIRQLPPGDANPEEVQPPELPEFRIGRALLTPPLVGLIDTIDGDTREVPLVARTPGRTYYHMAVELARLYWGLPAENILERDGKLVLVRGEKKEVVAEIPLTQRRDLEVNWFTRWDSPRNIHVSFAMALAYSQLLGSSDAAEKKVAEEFFAQFSEAVVLIGPVDLLLQDLAATPFDPVPVPRVGVHGNLLKTIMTGQYLWRPSRWMEDLLGILLALGLCALAVAGGARSVRNKALAAAVLAVYVALAFLLFNRWHLVLPLALPIGASFTTGFVAIGWQLIREEKQKGRIKGMFGAYVSPTLVNRMVESGEDPKLGGAEVEITAYFSDIQDFSALAELLPPAQLVELMNEYLTACTDVITEQGGTLDKYIGDAVVAMFGAPVALPDHAYRACIASQIIQQRLTELRGKWMEEGERWPALVTQMHTRIGLNSGTVVVGNMGSLTRFNYTMMGDNVNLASRLENAARNYGVATLVTEMTKAAAEKSGNRCVFRSLDKIRVKGRSRSVGIYELAGLKDILPRTTSDCVEIFNTGMEHYLRQDWTSAASYFSRSVTLEPARPASAGNLDPSTVFLKRCAALRLNPPGKDWDGVFVMQEK